ncbi:retrovirus-related pol polyprotein from transposon TNT 1-94 [Tanacetum coccineum]
MEGYKLKDLKSKGFDSIQETFDRAFKRVNTFKDFRTELVEGKEKRAGAELVQKSTKKQKVDDDKETSELKQCFENIPDEEEVTIDYIPLAVKSLRIVDWKIHKEGKKSYYQIVRVDGKSHMYMIFSHMLKSFDREDLEDLYKLVKARYGSTRPVEDLDLVLWNDLKNMFEPHVEDNIYMLVEKKYPLAPLTLLQMLEKKLKINYERSVNTNKPVPLKNTGWFRSAMEPTKPSYSAGNYLQGRNCQMPLLDDQALSRNHVIKFLRALPTKWHPKDLKIFKSKKEKYKSLALKARKISSDEEGSCFDSDDEEYAIAVRDFKKFFRRRGKFVHQPHDDKNNFRKVREDKKEKEDRRCFKCGDPNHFISDCPKHSFNDQKAFVVGCWSGSEEDTKKDEICLMAHDINELEADEWIKDSGCSRHMTGNKDLFSSYKAIDRGKKPSSEYFKMFGSKCFILNTKDYLTKFDPKSTKGVFLGYSPNSKAYKIQNKETMRVEESLNVRFDESPPPKSSPLVDDDILESEIIENQVKDLEIKENEPLNKEITNIKESKDHPIENVIRNLNERTLRSQVQNQNNFFYFISFVEPKNVKEAIKDES